MLAIPFSLRGHLAMRVNMKYVKAAIVFMHLACAGAIAAQGKIKLKRPGSSGGQPAGKIALTKPGGETAVQPAEDYTTSRGPESRSRTLYLGPLLGFNVSGVANGMQGSQNANGWDVSPVVGLRSELYFKRVYGIITDIGYEQNRAYVVETPTAGYAGQGILRTDYVILRSMFSYRFSLYKVFGKVKFLRPIAEGLKPFAGNLQAGLFAKTPLSAQLEILGGTVGDPNDPFYDVKQFTKPVSGGFMAGMGFELRLGSFIFFVEGQYFRGILNSYAPIQSRYFYTDKLSEQGVYFSSGIKTGIYGF